MKTFVLGLALVVAAAPMSRLPGQEPSDTTEAGRLRAQIEERFSKRVQDELQLSPDQATKLRATHERYGGRRRTLMQQQFERRRAIDDQMRPGVPANSDSLRKLMDGLRAGRAEMVKIENDEDQEMSGYLTPVQRARYQQIRGQFMQRVNELRMERREGRGVGGVRPGAGRGGRMGGQPGPRMKGGRRGRGI